MPLEMRKSVFITAAITGQVVHKIEATCSTESKEIADAAIDAAKAGAAIVHCHVRDPDTGAPSRDFSYYREVTDRIKTRIQTLF